jgi:hypothetical protein
MSPIAEFDFGARREPSIEATTMDDYMFKNHVRSCKNVEEPTSYLEILNYSVRLPPSDTRGSEPCSS